MTTCNKRDWKVEFAKKLKGGCEIAIKINEAKDAKAAEAWTNTYSKSNFLSKDSSFGKYLPDEFVEAFKLLQEKGVTYIGDSEIEKIIDHGWVDEWKPLKEGSIVEFRMAIKEGDLSIEGRRLEVIWDNGNKIPDADDYLRKVLKRGTSAYFPENWIEDWFHTGTLDKWESTYHCVDPYEDDHEWYEEVDLEAVKTVEGSTGLLPIEVHGKTVILGDTVFPLTECFSEESAKSELRLERDVLYIKKVSNEKGTFIGTPYTYENQIVYLSDYISDIYEVTERGLCKLDSFTRWEDIENPPKSNVPDWLE